MTKKEHRADSDEDDFDDVDLNDADFDDVDSAISRLMMTSEIHFWEKIDEDLF